MAIVERLRRLDARLVPDLGQRKYDSPRPGWVIYGPMAAVGLIFLAIYALAIISGPLGDALRAVSAASWAALTIGLIRWDRAHRIKSRPGG